MRTLAVILVFLAVGVGRAADKDAELKALEGAWEIDAATSDGENHTDLYAGMKLILKGSDYTIQFAENSDKGTFAIDPEKSPKWIDIKTGAKGPFKGLTLLGIYKIDGEKLTVCLQADGKARPTEFDAKKTTRNMLLTYKREKK
jgi:uncharacterized protein (TIGR03067 family)